MMKFNEINLPERIENSLVKIGYENLTPIQEKIIPAIQSGKDVLGCSQTGSGKTGAFLLPILSRILSDDETKAIVLAPTRELATQIMENVKLFTNDYKKLNRALLIGGASIREQLTSIHKNPRLIVGTPGRINDFLDSEKLNISEFNLFVLDEMDRMLDMGFSSQIDDIANRISKNRQTMLFSATISKKIEKVTAKYLTEPVIIKIGDSNQPSINVTQEIVEVENSEKFGVLIDILKGNTTFTLVFVKTKFGTERLAEKLGKEDIMAKAIHGDLKQNKRAKIIQDFRDKKFNVLVATDVAARGLDIHHIDTVINYDLPQSPEDYIHRIGRCSRGLDIKGTSISFCCRNEKRLLSDIQSLIKDGEYPDRPESDTRSSSRRNDRSSSTKRNFSKNTSERRPRTTNYRDNSERKTTTGFKSEERRKSNNSEVKNSSEFGNEERRKSYNNRDLDKKREFSSINKKPRITREKEKKDSNYDFDDLSGNRKKNMLNLKRPGFRLVSKTSAQERRKMIGLK